MIITCCTLSRKVHRSCGFRRYEKYQVPLIFVDNYVSFHEHYDKFIFSFGNIYILRRNIVIMITIIFVMYRMYWYYNGKYDIFIQGYTFYILQETYSNIVIYNSSDWVPKEVL